MQIQIDILDPSSIEKAIKQIEDYKKSLDTKLKELAERLCTIGVDIVKVSYLSGRREGNSNVDVYIEPTEKGCKLVAEGQDVCFLEFGAGVSTVDYEKDGQEGLPPIYPGSWSSTEGTGQFAENGYWYYNGEKLDGLMPKLGMYHASQIMQQKAIQEARKIFSND